ncbi:MAG: hypothetical protein E7619_04865 [Ruminococcaceae bacterium]|nr:hypothetical protein [Oscillospiraceae bacterium]
MRKVIDLIKTVDAVCPREEDVESVLKRAEEMASACEELLSGAAELKKKHFNDRMLYIIKATE